MMKQDHICHEPIISVIIPVYGVERFLQQCIDSLLNQTIDCCEYIFVNDASPDKCIDILLSNQKRCPHIIKIIDSKENLRQGGARNLGLAEARGKYIGYVDADDFVAPSMYENLLKKALETNADATYIQYTSIEVEDCYETIAAEATKADRREGCKREPIIKWDQRLLSMQGRELEDKDIQDLIALPVGGVWCGLYKKETLLKSGVQFPERIRYEDNYWGSIIKPSFRRVAFVEEIGVYYRKNPESTTHLRNEWYQVEDRIKIEQMIISEAEKRGYLERFKAAFEWGYTFRYAINTYYINIRTSDHPNVERIVFIEKDLRNRFPRWYRNTYYLKYTSFREKIRYSITIWMPRMTLILIRIKQRIKGMAAF